MHDHKIPRAEETAHEQTQCETNPPRRVLVVDDDGFMRHLNAETLIRSGCQVDTAENGANAWDMLQLKSYDLLITDNDMPKVSGVELLKRLNAANMTLPVVMATGTLPKEEFAQNPRLRPAAMLLKPFTGDELSGAVEKVLRLTNSARQQLCPILRLNLT
jgi:two-component system, OmpR family, alkaline phosphatase synthesis response regulator PhoP